MRKKIYGYPWRRIFAVLGTVWLYGVDSSIMSEEGLNILFAGRI